MKKYFSFILVMFLVGCSSFGRGLGEAFVDSNKKHLERCEVEGFEYDGVEQSFENEKFLKVLMVHGVGTHHPGYSKRIQQNLANKLNLTIRSRVPKNIVMLDPSDKKTIIGNLRITFWQNEIKSKNMLFYEQTWSEITTPDKKIISFDTDEQYSKFRVPFNNAMKKFLDNALPDPMIYLVDKQGLILDSSKQALCWMLKTNWNDLSDNQSEVCTINALEAINNSDKEDYMFITHSLGSKILMDALMSNANEIVSLKNGKSTAIEREAINKLQNKEFTVFMLANQLPILQIAREKPLVNNQINDYCYKDGKKYNSRIFKGVNIVAFSDPNDILSYAIPQSFADEYLDSRICPRVSNISVNVAPEISAFGFGVVNPVTAHTNYDNSKKVINLITNGTNGFYKDEYLKEKCTFIKLKKDSTMFP